MAKTLANLRAQTRTYLDESIAADWSNTEVDREVNHCYMRLYTATIEVFEDYYSTTSTDNTVEDQQEYDLPTGFYKMRRVEINYDVDTTGSVAQRALPISMDDVRRDLASENIGVTVQRHPAYYLRGDYVGFLPVPNESGTSAITLWHIAVPSELSATTDAINIPFPDRYGGLISLGAAGTLLRKGQQEEIVASKYLTEFELGLEKMKQELEDRYADDIKGVTDTRGLDTNFGRTHY